MQLEKVNVIAKPPAIYFISILAGILLQMIYSLSILPFLWLSGLGLLFVGVGVAVSIWGDQEFKQHDTAVNPDQPPTLLVTTGPYRFSRNPMYVGLTLIQLGLALTFNNLWLVLALVPTLLVMSRGVIDREEQFLATKFGQTYIDYKNSVRRWL
jgi:protein-S-isoprenylcysteine O-methyltransferase Ste14